MSDDMLMNWHHSDCSGKGDGDIYIDRYTHEIIHQENARVLRDHGYPTRGFCGDSFTLKCNNMDVDNE